MNFYQFPPPNSGAAVRSLAALPPAFPTDAPGFVWCTLARSELAAQLNALQDLVRRYSPASLLQLHLSDLANAQHAHQRGECCGNVTGGTVPGGHKVSGVALGVV